MTKFRLAVLNTQPPHLYFGGVERRIMETAKRLQTRVDIAVYCGTKAGFKASVAVEGATLIPCSSTDVIFPLDNWCFNRSLIKTASCIGVDVFEAHAVSGYGFVRKLRHLGIKKPFIHTIHGVLADEYEQAKLNGHQTLRDRVANNFMRQLAGLEKQMAQDADLIVTIGDYSLGKIQQHYGIDSDKVRIVPNGVDTERFKPADTDTVKRQFGLGAEPCVLFVGSLIPRKGLPFLVEAAKEVAAKQADIKFLIAGDGPLRGSLEETIKSAGLAANFLFLGRVGDDVLPLLYNCADVFVLPSIQEGQGIVLLEAQASGRPVVAFDVGGVNEAVCRGETGLLVGRGDVGGLAGALLKLLGDSALRVRMGLNGRRFVSENYTWDLCAQRMFDVYREVRC
ncbi:MAG: glycosyltransferase family 4 protein [Nitrososphaerota archaeon]|jgi:glycosyltransferase involved in cell wall biosynthesis|nr:glycosyltransferase family 4 protein [Nitrososphaerota archaeon]